MRDESPPTSSLERAVIAAFPWLLGGLLAAIPLLIVPGDADLEPIFLIHLSALTLLAVLVAWAVAGFMDGTWYRVISLEPFWRRLAAGASLVIIVTGVVGLVTLASSAALRYQPSVQFLQLISALDIAWVVAATLIGAFRLWGRSPAISSGLVIGAFCVVTIANYLRIVGFSADREWVVDGGELMRLVIPLDMAAALVAAGVLVAAARKD